MKTHSTHYYLATGLIGVAATASIALPADIERHWIKTSELLYEFPKISPTLRLIRITEAGAETSLVKSVLDPVALDASPDGLVWAPVDLQVLATNEVTGLQHSVTLLDSVNPNSVNGRFFRYRWESTPLLTLEKVGVFKGNKPAYRNNYALTYGEVAHVGTFQTPKETMVFIRGLGYSDPASRTRYRSGTLLVSHDSDSIWDRPDNIRALPSHGRFVQVPFEYGACYLQIKLPPGTYHLWIRSSDWNTVFERLQVAELH